MRFSKLLLLYGLFLLSTPTLAQKTKAQLQKEKKENLEKIKEAQATLQKTTEKKNVSIGQLNAYKFQINAQENLIATYKSEITLLENEIAQDEEIIDALKKDEENLKAEYAAMIYAAYKASRGQDKLTFLFSSKSFNQFFRRMQYMEQYAEARRRQVDQINAVRDMLTMQIASIELKKKEQADLLQAQLKEKSKLVALKEKEQKAVSSLALRENEIRKELEKRNKALAALNKLIDEIIKKEIEAAALAKAKAAEASKGLSSDFAKNKTHLPWPVSGFVSQHFGISKDPILKGVERNNPGIEVQTTPNTQVKCVSPGKVSSVAIIQGFNKAVIVSHGDYFTVYAKLSTVSVKKGQTLAAGDSIGTVFTGNDGIAELHFEIWKSFTKLNPEQWLTKK
ncbi:MAG: peptidoglycan DD-metalloendopeptidase family protein [Cyclobacteriaceae bacterium]|nr:peptidoglycan DD-metalloendopeptidase family protein [Cyclobacteriaceae bacterium]